MSYKNLENKFLNGEVVILDGGNGGELERVGAPMDGKLWCGRCSMENPDLVSMVHKSYIAAGADVITTNTYATPPIAMRAANLGKEIRAWNRKGVELAKECAKKSNRPIAIAGSVSTYGSWYRLGISALKPGFMEQAEILAESGVDFIILETGSSEPEIVEAAIDSTSSIQLPVWVSISCALDRVNNKLMCGLQESIDNNSVALLFEDFELVISTLTQRHKGPILVMHSDLKVTNEAVKKIRKNHDGVVGAYPNAGFWEKPAWRFEDNVTPELYLEEAKCWVSNGAQIVGGCCGVGPEIIEILCHLNNG